MSFSVLSLLPAVLLQVSLEGDWPALVGAGYALSAAAVIMHFWEIAGNGATLHQTALLVITVGFLTLAVVAVAAPALRKRRGGIRILASMCLALFAMSFVHFGKRARQPGVVERTGCAPCRNSAGPVRSAARLSVCTARCVRTLSDQRVAGRDSDAGW